MKKILLMTVFALFVTTGAAHADGQFSGPYVGLNLGGSHTNFSASDVPNGYIYPSCDAELDCSRGYFSNPSASDNGITGGGQVGYNWQTGRYVWGLEVDLNGVSNSITRTVRCDGTEHCASNEKMGSFATARARFGYTILDNLMGYVTAGPAVSHGNADWTNMTDGPRYNGASTGAYAFGWAAGIGAEYKLTSNIGIRGEYLHVQTAVDRAIPTGWDETSTVIFHSRMDQDVYRVGVNYFFDSSAKTTSGLSNANTGAFAGPFVGANIGLSHANSQVSVIPGSAMTGSTFGPLDSGNFDNPSISDNGFTGGIQAGYNWQFGKYVAGIEADWNGVNNSVKHYVNNCDSGEGCATTVNISSYATLRARAGYVFMDDLMGFISVGPAVSHSTADWMNPTCTDCSSIGRSAYAFGWAAGIGAEYKLTSNVGVKAEYLHVQTTLDRAIPTPDWDSEPQVAYHSKMDQDVFRVGVNWFFR